MLHHDLVLKHNELYLVGEDQTDFSRERATGLYARDTRFLDHWDLRINDVPLETLETRILGPDRALVVGANGALPADGVTIREPVPPLTIAVEQHVALGVDLRVRIVLGNYSGRTLPLTLSLGLGGDFRDMFDIRGFPRPRRDGAYLPPSTLEDGLAFGYTDRSGATTSLRVTFSQPPADVVDALPRAPAEPEQMAALPGFDLAPAGESPETAPPRQTAHFPVTLGPGEHWELAVTLAPVPVGEAHRFVTEASARRVEPLPSACIVTSSALVNRILARAMDDLAMLETVFPHGRLTAAGIPWYVAPFGRDSIIAALQTLHTTPGRAEETLRTLAALQGTRHDRFREEEPGKILHEMRYGEMARLGEIPHTPYFGSVDATPLFVMLFAETVRWTGDRVLYRELLPHVERALAWMEEFADRDGDGLVEYVTQSTGGSHIVHQGWKDSHDSLHHLDGQPVQGSIALVEVQGYVYAAYRWLAETAGWSGDVAWSAGLHERADRIQNVVEERFWLPEQGYYAQALDAGKRPVAAITTNAGHLLYCGLPSPERARAVAARLRQPDLDSGWGVRTLAAGTISYNPMSYHNGSVWPHDNSLIAAGLARYGEQEGLERITEAIFAVAERLPDHRLPELYCGFPRAKGVAADGPVPYPVSCSPQAWAAGSAPLLLRALLGLEADPQAGVVRLSPALPEWLPWVRLERVQALGSRFDLEVSRDGTGYRIDSEGPVTMANAVRGPDHSV